MLLGFSDKNMREPDHLNWISQARRKVQQKTRWEFYYLACLDYILF